MIETLLSGSVLGFFGGVAGKFFDYKSKKLDLEMQQKQLENNLELARIGAAAKVEVEEVKAFDTSLKMEPKKYSEGQLSNKQLWLMVIVDFLRGIIRPLLTGYLCFLTTVLYYKANKLMSLDLILPSMAYDINRMIIETILFLSVTTISWWFGSRATKAPKLK